MLLPLLFACATDPTETGAVTDTSDTSGDDGQRTLENCASSFGEGVPAFYSTYFRCVDVSVDGEDVIVGFNSLPPHPSAYYDPQSPNYEAWDDRGGAYVQNPNVLAEQAFVLRIPNEPVSKGIVVTAELRDLTMRTSDDEYAAGTIGVGLDGVSLYNATAAPGDDIRDEKYSFDVWEAHPSPDSTYHHHSPNPGGLAVLAALGLVTTPTPGAAEVELYGINCDGTVVLGCTELDGGAVDTADFDAQSGHTGNLVGADGVTHFSGRYHTHVCSAFDADAFTPEIQVYDRCEVSGVQRP